MCFGRIILAHAGGIHVSGTLDAVVISGNSGFFDNSANLAGMVWFTGPTFHMHLPHWLAQPMTYTYSECVRAYVPVS